MPSHVMGYCINCEETFGKYHELEYHIKVKHTEMKEKKGAASNKLIKLEVEIDNDRISSVKIEDEEENDIDEDVKRTKRKRSAKVENRERRICGSPEVKVEKEEKVNVKTRSKIKKEPKDVKLINVEVTDLGNIR